MIREMGRWILVDNKQIATVRDGSPFVCATRRDARRVGDATWTGTGCTRATRVLSRRETTRCSVLRFVLGGGRRTKKTIRSTCEVEPTVDRVIRYELIDLVANDVGGHERHGSRGWSDDEG